MKKSTLLFILQFGLILVGFYSIILLLFIIPNLSRVYEVSSSHVEFTNPSSSYGFWVFLSIGMLYFVFAGVLFFLHRKDSFEPPSWLVGVAILMNIIPLSWYAFTSYISSEAIITLLENVNR